MAGGEAAWDRVAGCLHGLLIGDAMGCPVEGWTPAEIAEEFGVLRDMREIPGARWRPRGLHSDDGQQALAVVDALCSDPEHPERKFAELMVQLREAAPQRAGRYGLHRGVGRNFRATVRGLRGSNVADPLAHALPTAGNGAAMRIAAVGLWWRDAPELRDDRAAVLSAVTHRDMRGIAAAQTIAIAVAQAFAPEPMPVLTRALPLAVARAQTAARERLDLGADPRFLDALTELVAQRRHCDDLDELLAGIAARAPTAGFDRDRRCEPTSGFAACSVLTALAIVDLARDFEQAVITAINLGGDSDTIGAMVGAVAGARWGLAAIPPRWLDDLHATGSLVERVDLVLRREPNPPWPPLLELEREWDALFDRGPTTNPY